MACIVSPPVVTDLTDAYSSKEDFNGKDHDESDISKNIQKLNDEQAHGQEREENIEKSLGDVVCDMFMPSNEESCYNQEKLENEASNIVIDKIYPSDGINLNESSKKNELQIDDKKSCDTDNNSTVKKILKRALSLADSDSEETNFYETLNKDSIDEDEYRSGSPEYSQIAEPNNSKNRRRIIDSESEEDTQTSEGNNFSQMVHETISTTAESYRGLIDSESEEEKQNETENDTSVIPEETSESKDAKKKLVKKRKGSIRASKDEAMRQIHSETQRLLRETEVSLPYHRPKQRTLQEFLNRKKISAALPKAPSTAAKLKMSSAIVSRVLAEKEKEAELFYKSSDSEDDMQQSMSFVSKDMKKSFITNEREKLPSIDIDHICIQGPERIGTSTQDSQDNEKEIVQEDRLDLNVPRCKVLEKDLCEVDHQAVKLFLTDNSNLGDESDTLLRQITDECNQNLSKLSLPRKLFDTSFENESNEVSEINLNAQKETEETVETVITSLNKEKCTTTEDHTNEISKVHQDDSEVINEKNKNQVIEAMKISEMSNGINSKEVTETFQSDNDISDNVICSNPNDCIITQYKNNEKEDECSETNNVAIPSHTIISDDQSEIQLNSSTNECEKFDGHVQGLPLPEFADETLLNRKKLSALVSNSKVTLRGSPGMIIDLTGDAKPNVKGVNTLLDRFFCKHTNTKKNDNNSEVTVIHLQDTQNGPVPIKEVLPYKVPTSTDNPELNKPGSKLMRLKEDLKLQMTLKRNKEWKQKEMELQAQEKEEWDEEERDYDSDEQDKAELVFESSGSEESEPEENDIYIKEKKRSKCLFADDEAEVTDNEDSSTEETCIEDDTDHVKQSKQFKSFKYRKEYMDDDVSEVEIDQEEEEEENDDDDDGEDEDENEEPFLEEKEESLDANMENRNKSNFKNDSNVDVCKSLGIATDKNDRKTRQLTEELQDDSNITNPSYLRSDNSQLNIVADIGASKAHCEDNDWISENESNMPACQQYAEVATRSQICKTPSTKTSMLDLVSPITQLSILNTTLDSNKKDLSEGTQCLVDKHEFFSIESTQCDESSEHIYNRNKTILKKKLFDDIGETIDDEYLMRLCSGKFESTQKIDLGISSQSNITEVSQLCPSESESCPGNSNVKLVDVKQSKNLKENDKMLQDIRLILDEDSNSVNYGKGINKVNAMDSKLKLRVASSDDEDDEDLFVKSKKRLARRFNLSDSEEESSQFSDEENDDVDNEEAEEQYVDYDSEENEVTVVPEKDIKKVAASFLEEEAELSESDWDSADEDEKDLDKLEFEEADDEHLDEHEVKDQLEKIHMKQMLDEDKREVRYLKELLFEDGDLHTDGSGRERKFKWRNIDKLGSNIEMPQISDENDGWVDVQEDEEEAKWSKLRHERDKFLEERMKSLNNEIEDELCDSQIFKLGLEAVKKIKGNESQKQDTSFDKVESPENMEPIMPRNITDLLNGPNIGKKSQTIYNVIKRRSLLSRGEESLARIASLAKQGDSASHAASARNFVFPHIGQDTDNTLKKKTRITGEDLNSQIKPGKRKMMSNVSSVSKKRRK
ncbi:claspin [Temnothorax curvispinosus]|uniref:Claspin n=1 Tax=Temnothorax curvispinosus TaxID=300111 RepID=A0A6J1QM10_9HYME|nr:claspin [Temnothorax curvispinosus]